MLMAQLHALFRSLSAMAMPLGQAVSHVNRVFCESALAGQYVTLVCGQAKPTGEVEIHNAGHWPAIVVGVTVFFLVIVASIDQLSCIPANVYGYAALVGYTLSAGKLDALTAADNSNPLFLIIVSGILGGVLGYLMGHLAGVLKVKPAK